MPAEEGQLWFNNDEDELTLYVYTGANWVPASPPVSLDGINTTITGIEGDLIELHNNVRQQKGDIVLTNKICSFWRRTKRGKTTRFPRSTEAIDDLEVTRTIPATEIKDQSASARPAIWRTGRLVTDSPFGFTNSRRRQRLARQTPMYLQKSTRRVLTRKD